MRRIFSILIALVLALIMVSPAFADAEKSVVETRLVIDDEADLFTKEEEAVLSATMNPLCEYGYTILETVDSNDLSTEKLARQKLEDYGSDGMVFLIDLDNREIYIHTTYRALTAGKCYSITDNVYSYASSGDYFNCADEGLKQCAMVMNGQRISEPMKYIDNALFAIIIAIVICFIWMLRSARKEKLSAQEIAMRAKSTVVATTPAVAVVGHRRVRHESGIASSGGLGGGGTGGGHGGGHSF